MTVIVTDTGFSADNWRQDFIAQDTLDLPSDYDLAASGIDIDRIMGIRVAFPVFTNGRGFSLARSLRISGYSARLRAVGEILPDQYAMMRRVGFDEIELTDEQAAKYPEEQWLMRTNWTLHDYQQRLQP